MSLQVGIHNLLDPTNLCIFKNFSMLKLHPISVQFKSLKHYIHSNFITEFKAVYKSFFSTIHFNSDITYQMLFYSCLIRRW